jgi:tetratricopeptide (TPR) repeat protein
MDAVSSGMKLMSDARWRRIAIAACLVVATLAGLWPLLSCGFVNFDDPSYILDNPHVRSGISMQTVGWAFTSTEEANWHPVTWLSHALDFSLFGPEPAYHHATNLLLHIVSSLVLFFSLERATRSLWKSAFVAFVFALHPLHVESVGWIAERKDVLSGCFAMLSIAAYLRYARSGRRAWYLSAAGLFALGLMSKPALVTLPFVFLLLDYWPLGRLFAAHGSGKSGGGVVSFKQAILEKPPFFILSVASSAITFWVQRTGGAMDIISSLPFPYRAANAALSYFTYLRESILPSGLAVFYPHPGENISVWEAAGSALLLGAVTFWLWRERARFPYLIAGWLWFLGMLVPVLGLVQVGLQGWADRYMYLPLIGLAIMAAWGIPEALSRIRLARFALPALFVLALLAMLPASRAQASYWKNSRTLFERALSVTTGNYLAHNNLGADLADSGDHAGAIVHLREAIRIKPEYIEAHHNLAVSLMALGQRDSALAEYRWVAGHGAGDAELRASLGSDLAENGQLREAAAEFAAATALEPGDPAAHCALARVYLREGKADSARAECLAALRLRPGYSAAHTVLGMIAGGQLKNDEALREFAEAIRLDSASAEAYNSLGILYDRMGRGSESLAMYEAAVRNDSGNWNAQFNLGTALARRGRYPEAAGRWSKSVELNPSAIDARLNLGKLYAVQKKFDEAGEQFAGAIRIDSNNVQAHFNYGDVLALQGRFREAESQYQQALRIAPDLEPVKAALRRLRGLEKR